MSPCLNDDEVIYLGEDKYLDLEVLDDDDVPVDIEDFTVVFDMREKPYSSVTMISVTCSVVGTYSATRSANTQRARATLTDDQTTKFSAGRYAYSFKRTDAGSEAILRDSVLTFKEATQK